MIVPPVEIRVVIEKLAAHVAKNGPALEAKITEKERGNLRFCFLAPADPYNEYYCSRKSLYAQIDAAKIDEVLADSPVLAEAQRLRTRADGSQPDRLVSSEPEDKIKHEYYSGDSPIAPEDYSLILYTALHVAACGGGFEAALRAREAHNPLFSFLRDTAGPMHRAYTDALRQYRCVLDKKPFIADERSLDSTTAILNRAQLLAQQSDDKSGLLGGGDDIQRSYADIVNWDQFAVVETADFGLATTHLPAPLSLNTVARLTTAQRLMLFDGQFSEVGASISAGRALSDALALSFDAADFKSTPSGVDVAISALAAGSDTLHERFDHSDSAAPGAGVLGQGQEAVRMRDDRLPRSIRKASGASQVQCPMCKGTFGADVIGEHMRVEALDPKWHEQRQKYLAKHAGTNLATTDAEVLQALEAMHERRAPSADASVSGAEPRPPLRGRRKRT